MFTLGVKNVINMLQKYKTEIVKAIIQKLIEYFHFPALRPIGFYLWAFLITIMHKTRLGSSLSLIGEIKSKLC